MITTMTPTIIVVKSVMMNALTLLNTCTCMKKKWNNQTISSFLGSIKP